MTFCGKLVNWLPFVLLLLIFFARILFRERVLVIKRLTFLTNVFVLMFTFLSFRACAERRNWEDPRFTLFKMRKIFEVENVLDFWILIIWRYCLNLDSDRQIQLIETFFVLRFCGKLVNWLPFVLLLLIFCYYPILGKGIGYQATNFLDKCLCATCSLFYLSRCVPNGRTKKTPDSPSLKWKKSLRLRMFWTFEMHLYEALLST